MISKFQRSLGWNVWVSHMYNGVQHATTSNEGKPKPRYLQKCVERLDMEKHTFILIIFFIAVKVFWIKKQIYNTISFIQELVPTSLMISRDSQQFWCTKWRLNSRVNTNDIFTESCHKEFHRENYFNKFKIKFISRLFSVCLCFGTEKHARSSIIKIPWIGVGMLWSKEKTLECLKVYSK